jgi:hypothetical protein
VGQIIKGDEEIFVPSCTAGLSHGIEEMLDQMACSEVDLEIFCKLPGHEPIYNPLSPDYGILS